MRLISLACLLTSVFALSGCYQFKLAPTRLPELEHRNILYPKNREEVTCKLECYRITEIRSAEILTHTLLKMHSLGIYLTKPDLTNGQLYFSQTWILNTRDICEALDTNQVLPSQRPASSPSATYRRTNKCIQDLADNIRIEWRLGINKAILEENICLDACAHSDNLCPDNDRLLDNSSH